MKNIKLNGQEYIGVEKINLPTVEGGETVFYENGGGNIQPLKEVSATELGPLPITPDDNYDGMEKVIVNVDIEGEQVERTITANGPYTINVPGSLMSDVILDVNVPTSGGEVVQGVKTDSTNQNGVKTVTPDEGYTAMRSVQLSVNIPASTPDIDVSDNGNIHVTGDNIVTTDHRLSQADCVDFTTANIAKGKYIFGLTGTFEGEGSDSPFEYVGELTGRSGELEQHAGGYLDITVTPPSNGNRQLYVFVQTYKAPIPSGAAGGGTEFGVIEVQYANGVISKCGAFMLNRSGTNIANTMAQLSVSGNSLTIPGSINNSFWHSNSTSTVWSSEGNKYALYKITAEVSY